MFRKTLIYTALVAAGLGTVAATLKHEPADFARDSALAGVLPIACKTPERGQNAFFKLAAVKTEVRPFDRLLTDDHGPATDEAPPLWETLGTLSYPITTKNPKAQQYFDQGLRLAYAFNHPEARRAFKQARTLDPDCAMCYWGEALVLGPNINAPMDPADNPAARDAVAKAQALASRASAREQALIKALNSRYTDDPKVERTTLDAAYAEAMGRLAKRFPDDQQIAVLYAESFMDLQPWDYWTTGGTQPKGRTAEIIATLERVLRENPDHPGAIHYYIHMVEASSTPERAVPYAERLGRVMPGAGHLVHMPSHIWYRIGRYRDSLEANRKAIAADEAYFASTKTNGAYVQVYHPHNVHMLLVSAQMAGDGQAVIEAAQRLSRTVTDEAAQAVPLVQPIKAAVYFAHAQFSDPATTLALPDPGDALPYVKGMWHYARGVAQALAGDLNAARREAERIAALEDEADFTALTNMGIPAQDVLAIAQHVVQGRIAQAEGDLKRAASEFEQAIAFEDSLGYMEPPYWYYPVRQSLGAVRLALGDLDGAASAFRESLARVPHNAWSLYGLAQVQRKRGDTQAVEATERLFARAWAGEDKRPDLQRL